MCKKNTFCLKQHPWLVLPGPTSLTAFTLSDEGAFRGDDECRADVHFEHSKAAVVNSPLNYP